ncbi:MAG: FHA domain-containing protein [Deltaproteobacteria bacterium]|uniref:FHA domain-containing protein n=1 Tax=Candidatus Zymogenus saltonus TaxID=2844893 RepID=A0A9D8PPG2_9DELT|nr:FHA domain-containing protein [Candidatus Zymogenus saltonus]
MIKKICMLQLLTVILALLIFNTPPAFSKDTTYISDIIANPTKFMNINVRISGRVQKSNPAGPTTPGSYVLTDDSFESITVITYNPPAPGAQITIDGLVQIDTETQIPYIRELKVVKGFPLPIYAVIAGLVVLCLIITLVIVLKKPIESRQPAEISPSAVSSRPRTEKISETEADVLSGRPRTEKVPSKQAQIEILTGEKKGEQILLVTENVIGRDKGNIRFAKDRGVSGEHARINYVGGRYYLTNVSLTNPTKVNKKTIEEEYELKDGDEILLGTVRAKFGFLN